MPSCLRELRSDMIVQQINKETTAESKQPDSAVVFAVQEVSDNNELEQEVLVLEVEKLPSLLQEISFENTSETPVELVEETVTKQITTPISEAVKSPSRLVGRKKKL